MKKTILTIVVASTTLFACSGSSEKETCGSEGHTCSSECAAKEETEPISATEESTTETNSAEEVLAEHTCNEFCKEGACNYAHGEKGHACGSDCL